MKEPLPKMQKPSRPASRQVSPRKPASKSIVKPISKLTASPAKTTRKTKEKMNIVPLSQECYHTVDVISQKTTAKAFLLDEFEKTTHVKPDEEGVLEERTVTESEGSEESQHRAAMT